ncbi:MAG: dTMP kinase [Candidatus Omnitrophota bacterium]|nr:dTMP kinase [Candidatus Omnitrophota bacterium]
MSLRKGFFITLEGSEGSGKSSQAMNLAKWLRARQRPVVLVRDPGSTALGRALRQVLLHSEGSLSPLTEALLFIGGRVALVEERIRPALRRGRVVVCDRYHDSTVVYQGDGGGVSTALLERIGRRAIGGLMPSLTIVLDVPTTIGFRRIRRAHDRMERKARAFHRRVRAGFLRLARREPRRIVVVDASRPAAHVQQQIEAIVMKRLHR